MTLQQFLTDAQQADTDYGPVTSATLVSTTGDLKSSAKLIYTVTRKKGAAATTYQATVQMVSVANVWGVSDLGASIYPTLGGVKPVPSSGTPTVSPTATK